MKHSTSVKPATSSPSPGARALRKLGALLDSTLPLTQQSLCVAILRRENSASGVTYASLPRLAADAKVSVRTARRDLTQLVHDGVIERQRRKHDTSLLSVSLSGLHKLRRGKPTAETAHVVQSEDGLNAHHVSSEERVNSHVVPRQRAPRVNSGVHHVHPNSLEENSSAEEQATNFLLNELPGVPAERIRQAARLATLLASSPPNSPAYYRRAVPDIAANFEAKRLAWLVGEAGRRLGGNGDLRRPDLAEELKTLCAENGLPYSGELVGDAIDAAARRREAERQAQVELRAGACAR